MSVAVIVSAVILVIGCALVAPMLGRTQTPRSRGGRPLGIDRSAASHRLRSHVSPFRVIFVTVALAVYALQVPHAAEQASSWIPAFFGGVYQTVQVFLAGADLGALFQAVGSDLSWVQKTEDLYVALVFALAPLLAVGFVLTFFNALTARLRYTLAYFQETNVFTELNERTLALASSIDEACQGRGIKACLVFTGAADLGATDLADRARQLGAICFDEDVLSLPLYRHRRDALLRLFVMGSEESNVVAAAGILANPGYRTMTNTDLFLFSDAVESELVFRNYNGPIRVRRVSAARTLVYDWLWGDNEIQPEPPSEATRGFRATDLFTTAVPRGREMVISVALVGLGTHGLEMLRALAWYCQMDGDGIAYNLIVNAFDADQSAPASFRSSFPGLAEKREWCDGPRQDAYYSIEVHGGVSGTSPDLVERVLAIDPLTFVFISLGDDSTNLEVATKLRRELSRQRKNPQILSLSRHSGIISTALESEAAVGRQAGSFPAIDLIGDVRDVYSYKSVVRSVVEWNGLVCHMGWARRVEGEWAHQVREFWSNEYCYRSSTAIPVHWRARRAIDVPGARLSSRERSPEQIEGLERLEHARWCAFLRSQGFVRGDSKDVVIAKTHPLLVPFDELDAMEKAKDDNDSKDIMERLSQELAALKKEAAGQGAASSGERRFVQTLQAFLDEARPFVEQAPEASTAL